MTQKMIVIDFTETGEPTIEVNGMLGTSCKDATKHLEAAFGITDQNRKARAVVTEKPELRQQSQLRTRA